MTATKQYFVDQIADTITKALGLPLTVELHKDGEIVVTMRVEGPGADSPFWKAVQEQMKD